MKISEYLHKEKSNCSYAMETIKDFDYTNFEVEEIFESIKDCFNVYDCEKIVYVITPELIGFNCNVEILTDNKFYPLMNLVLNLNSEFFEGRKVSVKLSPFGCVRIYGNVFDEVETKRKLSKAIARFMKDKFDVGYLQKRNVYLRAVKDARVKSIQEDADAKIELVEKEYKDSLFNF